MNKFFFTHKNQLSSPRSDVTQSPGHSSVLLRRFEHGLWPVSSRHPCPHPAAPTAHPAVTLHMLQMAFLADAQVQEVLPLYLQGLLVGLWAAAWSPQATPHPGPSTHSATHPFGWARPLSPSWSPQPLGSSPMDAAGVPEAAGPSHLDGPHSRVPELHHALPVVLQLVHTLLLAQQLMLLEVLGESWRGAVRTRTSQSPPRPHSPPLTSYSLRRPSGSAMRSLQSCCRMRCCCWARALSWRVQPCRCVYRLPRLCPRHEAVFCAQRRGGEREGVARGTIRLCPETLTLSRVQTARPCSASGPPSPALTPAHQ